MSGTFDSNIDAEEAIRLVSINADALLKTSPTARNVLVTDGSWQKPGRASSPNAWARTTDCPSAVKTPIASVYSKNTVASMSIGHTMCLPVVSESETTSTAVSSTKTRLSSTLSVERAAQEIRLDCVTVTGDQEASHPALTQSALSNDALKSNTDRIAGSTDIPVTNEPYTTVHTLPSAVSTHSPSKSLSAIAVSEEPELLEKSIQLNKNDSRSSCPSQTAARGCPLDASKKDVVTASSDSSDGKLSFTTQHPKCSSDGTSNQMEGENDNIETTASDRLPKTASSSETGVENDQWAESAEAEMELKPAEKSKEQTASVKKIAVFRDTENSVSRKPSRIVSFTTEDFDLFQSKCVAVHNFS